MPYWARLILAAKYLKMSPLELMAADEPDTLIEMAGVLSNAEHLAAEARRAQNAKK